VISAGVTGIDTLRSEFDEANTKGGGSIVANRSATLKFGARVKFQDRWEGTLAAIDVSETWEVINLIVSRGFLRWTSSVKLPFSIVRDWSDDRVTLDCTSLAAFAREIPPIAAPARPISAHTPVGLPQATLAGMFVSETIASALLIEQGSGVKRRLKIAVEAAVFEGKTLRVLEQSESLPSYHSDDEIREAVRRALASEGGLLPDDRKGVGIEVSNGGVHLRGNVRTRAAKERAGQAAGGVEGVTAIENEVVDDADIEMAIGRLLDRSGLQRTAPVFARSSLGVVTLYGYPTSDRAAFEVIRAVSKISGVQRLISRLETAKAAA
jgi:osmotically-inducible protein OsmY